MPKARIRAFATDLDRTILSEGGGPTATGRDAVRSARRLGLKVLLVSGRRLEELRGYALALGRFDGIVAENGAVIEAPRDTQPVVVDRRVGAAVRRALPAPLSSEGEFGEVVASFPIRSTRRLARRVATLPVRLVPNVDRVMVLPKGVTKSTGVRRALGRIDLAGGPYAAIGDGENDVELLEDAALSGAVANAAPVVRRAADYVCRSPFSEGVLEFVAGPLARIVGGGR